MGSPNSKLKSDKIKGESGIWPVKKESNENTNMSSNSASSNDENSSVIGPDKDSFGCRKVDASSESNVNCEDRDIIKSSQADLPKKSMLFEEQNKFEDNQHDRCMEMNSDSTPNELDNLEIVDVLTNDQNTNPNFVPINGAHNSCRIYSKDIFTSKSSILPDKDEFIENSNASSENSSSLKQDRDSFECEKNSVKDYSESEPNIDEYISEDDIIMSSQPDLFKRKISRFSNEQNNFEDNQDDENMERSTTNISNDLEQLEVVDVISTNDQYTNPNFVTENAAENLFETFAKNTATSPLKLSDDMQSLSASRNSLEIDPLSDILKSDEIDVISEDFPLIEMLHDLDPSTLFSESEKFYNYDLNTQINKSNENHTEKSTRISKSIYWIDHTKNYSRTSASQHCKSTQTECTATDLTSEQFEQTVRDTILENVSNIDSPVRKIRTRSVSAVNGEETTNKENSKEIQNAQKKKSDDPLRSKSSSAKTNTRKSLIETENSNLPRTRRYSVETKSHNDDINHNDLTINHNISQDLDRLRSLIVRLQHKVPPQHLIEQYPLSKKLQYTQQKEFEKYSPLKKGFYSTSEDKILINNWEEFCRIHNWDSKNPYPFYKKKEDHKFFIKNSGQRRKFVQFLAKGLTWRSLNSIFTRFTTIYYRSEFQGQYTKEEDKEILSLSKQNLNSTQVAQILKRNPRSVSSRLYRLNASGIQDVEVDEKPRRDNRSFKWTPKLIHKFITQLMEVTNSKDVSELKDVLIPKCIWLEMENRMSTDFVVLKTFWYYQLHMQLFCTKPVSLNETKIRLIKYMYCKGISSSRSITWKNVRRYFDGYTIHFLKRVFHNMIYKKINYYSFPDLIEILHEEKVPQLLAMETDSCLQKLIYTRDKILVAEILEEKELDDSKLIETKRNRSKRKNSWKN